MTYKNILSAYEPEEEGTFLYRYRVRNYEYIFFSPQEGTTECLETDSFTLLSPLELAFNLNQAPKSQASKQEEFSFQSHRSREEIIQYLFDIDKGSPATLQECRVEDSKGYLMEGISAPHKIRNFYKFKGNTCCLAFHYKICYSMLYVEKESNVVSLCWDPYHFSLLEKTEEKEPAYLLASDHPALYAYLVKILEEKAYSRIHLYVGEHINEALGFFLFYRESTRHKKDIRFFYDLEEVTLVLEKWDPLLVMKKIIQTQRDCIANFKQEWEKPEETIDYKVYNCNYLQEDNYISCKNNSIFVKPLFKMLLAELEIDEICAIFD